GAWDIAPAWWEQLEPDGRLVLPLSIGGVEVLVAFEPRDGHLASLWVHRTGFVPLRGPGAAQRTRVPLGPDPVLYLETDTPEAVDGDAASALLAGRYQDHPTGLDVTQREVSDGLLLWLAAREPELAELVAQ